MNVVRWEDPPPPGNTSRYDWAAIGAELVKQPGRWALVAIAFNSSTASSMVQAIRVGRYVPLAALGRFEAQARTVDGEARVYARFLGESKPDGAA